MKATYIFTIFLFSQFHSFAQVWIDSDASWHYNVDAGSLFQGFNHLQYTADSMIQGHNCQVIEAYQHRATNYNSIYSHSDFQLETNYTYVNGDTVFWLVDDEFKVLYNFGAQVGDTWVIAEANTDTECQQTIVQVDDIGTVDLNEETFRWISFHSLGNSSYFFGGKALERFGMYEIPYHSPHSLFPVENDCTANIEFFFHQFTCYEDASFNLLNTSTLDCEFARTLSLTEESTSNFGIQYYVDQENSLLHLNSDASLDNVKCTIYNNMGQVVFPTKVILNTNNNDVIHFSNLNSGIYYVVLQSDNLTETGKFVLTGNN